MQQAMNTPPPAPTSQYYVAVNGQQSGPYSVAQLQQYAAAGQFTPQSMVWKQGMAAWDMASNVAELAAIFAPATPPVPPVPPAF